MARLWRRKCRRNVLFLQTDYEVVLVRLIPNLAGAFISSLGGAAVAGDVDRVES